MELKQISTYLPKIEVVYDRTRLSTPIFVKSSKDAFDLFTGIWDMKTIDLYEEMKAIFVDRKMSFIGYRDIGMGSSSGTIANIKLLLGIAITSNAEGFILAHNHPSGSLKPSEADINLTGKIVEGSKNLDLKLFDHIIVTKEGYYSFADEGEL